MARPLPPDRREVRPEHLLRAVLDDALVDQVLTGLGTSGTAVRTTLEHRMLETVDDIGDEVLFALGIDIETVLVVLNPPYDEPDWRGRTLSPAARDVLVKALVESSRSKRAPRARRTRAARAARLPRPGGRGHAPRPRRPAEADPRAGGAVGAPSGLTYSGTPLSGGASLAWPELSSVISASPMSVTSTGVSGSPAPFLISTTRRPEMPMWLSAE